MQYRKERKIQNEYKIERLSLYNTVLQDVLRQKMQCNSISNITECQFMNLMPKKNGNSKILDKELFIWHDGASGFIMAENDCENFPTKRAKVTMSLLSYMQVKTGFYTI